MAGEIQLNSTTMATESSGTITLSNVNSATNRTNLGLGSMATQDANAVALTGGSLTGTEIDLKSSGTTIFKSDGTTAVLSESGGVVTLGDVEFPALVQKSSSTSLIVHSIETNQGLNYIHLVKEFDPITITNGSTKNVCEVIMADDYGNVYGEVVIVGTINNDVPGAPHHQHFYASNAGGTVSLNEITAIQAGSRAQLSLTTSGASTNGFIVRLEGQTSAMFYGFMHVKLWGSGTNDNATPMGITVNLL